MHIIGWIIIIAVGLCMICSFVYMVMVCLSLWKYREASRRTFRKRNKKKLCSAFVLFLASIICVSFCVRGLWSLRGSTKNDDYKDGQLNAQYEELIETIPFNNEITSEKEIIWEHLIHNELLYGGYLEWNNSSNNFDSLRNTYKNKIYYANDVRFVEIDELLEHVEEFYDSEILPATDKTLEEVDHELKKNKNKEEKCEPCVELYQNEFWLRVEKYRENSSNEQLYYAAVAADNVFKGLYDEGKLSGKQAIFYGSMAVAFYLASVNDYEENSDLILIYYRISEIYIYLEKYIDFGEDNAAYNEHFLLMAEQFLMLAETEYGRTAENGDIHAHNNITYFGHYYANICYKFMVEYESKDETLFSKCRSYAVQYLDSLYTKEYQGARKSCKDILIKLEQIEKDK